MQATGTTPEISRWQKVWQYLIPQHTLSALLLYSTSWQLPIWKNWQIRTFCKLFQVDLREAVDTDINDYDCFNDFFTRQLKADARPLDPDPAHIVSPVDGSISACSQLQDMTLIQAKGHSYSLPRLLGGDDELARQFHNGHYATLYLSPRDYHRIHIPLDGKLQRSLHIPGRRFAVNPVSVQTIPRLFARNERLVNIFTTAIGPMAVIMVGALCVGSMATIWDQDIKPAGRGNIADHNYSHLVVRLKRGAELGHFNIGSTVILLFPEHTMQWLMHLRPGQQVRMGEAIGRIIKR